MTTDIFSYRLRAARTIAGLSLRSLADRMAGVVSHTALANYEKGTAMPDSTVLLALAAALNVKTDFFFRPLKYSIRQIAFRQNSRLSAKVIESIKEEVNEHLERYLELEELLGIAPAFQNPLAGRLIADGEAIEQAAEDLLQVWQAGYNALSNVVEWLEEKEIKIVELANRPQVAGLSGWVNNEVPVIVLSSEENPINRRFTALHELAHLLLTFSPALNSKAIEKLCNRFASAVLMPRTTFLHEIGSSRSKISISELIPIKEHYGIPIHAIMQRAADLDVISKETLRHFKSRAATDERLQEARLGNFTGREQSGRFRQLLHRAVAEEIITMSKAAALANCKLADFREEFIAV